MFVKRTLLAGLLIAVVLMSMPNLSSAQVWLQNYLGSLPNTRITNWANGMGAASTFEPAYTEFIVDSVLARIYMQGVGGNVQATLLEAPGTAYSAVCGTCNRPVLPARYTTSPGTTIPATGWYGFSIPDCTMYGTFHAGVITNMGVTGDLSPFFNADAPPCCREWLRVGGTWYDNGDYGLGNYSVGLAVHGTNSGTPNPPTLLISPPEIFYGNALIPWQGGPEDITHTGVIFRNQGGGTDTVTAIVSTDPDFYWTGNALPWYLGPNESELIDVTFQTTTEGDRYAGLAVTHTGINATQDTLDLHGIGYNGHWLENFYQLPDPLIGAGWAYQRYGALDEEWGYYGGGYADQDACMGHQWGDPDSFISDMGFPDTFFVNPNNGGVVCSWWQETRYNSDYYFHALYWTAPQDSYWYYVDECPPTEEGEYVEVTKYINATTDSIRMGFLYEGQYAASWFIDDVRCDTLPPLPPEISGHQHHSDDGPATFESSSRITAQVIDPNADPMTIRVYYADLLTMVWNFVAMTPVQVCEFMNLYEALVPFDEICHSYGYYIYADDGVLSSTLPATAPADYYRIDIFDNTQPQTYYDDGDPRIVRYDPYYWETRYAVQFVPTFPYVLGGAMVMVGNTFPPIDGKVNHYDIVIEVYNDGGPGGEPGTLMAAPEDSNGTSWNLATVLPDTICGDTSFASWVYVKIDPCIIIDDTFYIAARNRNDGTPGGTVNTNRESFGVDDIPSTPYRSWIFDGRFASWGLDTLDSGDPDYLADGDIMIRAIECACVPEEPTDVTIYYYASSLACTLRWTDVGDNTHYHIYKSTTDPYSGFVWLATVAAGIGQYGDPIGADAKAFYYVAGDCDDVPGLAAPDYPTFGYGEGMRGPVRVTRPTRDVKASLQVGEEYTIEELLDDGVRPNKIKKSEIEHMMKIQSRKATGSWNVK